jgi:hypothetical protein
MRSVTRGLVHVSRTFSLGVKTQKLLRDMQNGRSLVVSWSALNCIRRLSVLLECHGVMEKKGVS